MEPLIVEARGDHGLFGIQQETQSDARTHTDAGSECGAGWWAVEVGGWLVRVEVLPDVGVYKHTHTPLSVYHILCIQFDAPVCS